MTAARDRKSRDGGAWRDRRAPRAMAKLGLAALFVGATVGLARTPIGATSPPPALPPRALAPTLDHALSAASELPGKRLLEAITGSAAAAAAALQQMAFDPNRPPGVRLRALASLASWPSPGLRDELRNLLDGYAAQGALQPIDVWMVRGALEVLATCGDADDVARITTWLEWEASRDVRARAAWALGRLGAPGGIDALKKRFLREAVGQVSFQITAALALLEP